jgi:hypothetical protein
VKGQNVADQRPAIPGRAWYSASWIPNFKGWHLAIIGYSPDSRERRAAGVVGIGAPSAAGMGAIWLISTNCVISSLTRFIRTDLHG